MSEVGERGAGHESDLDVSVIIVNYNVRYFLEQCIHAVLEASKRLRVEIIVVDNASADDSIAYLRRSQEIVSIINPTNVGFAKANNQGIAIARGRYVLLLNPDTLISETSLDLCFAQAEADPTIGAIGARMLDGRGEYLPESKRGLPTPWVSFTKMSGLGSLAPESERFNRYYAGHLRSDQRHEVEVLPGAFMFLRASMLPTLPRCPSHSRQSFDIVTSLLSTMSRQ